MKSVHIYTLGCKSNRYEADSLYTEFALYGYQPEANPEVATVIIINSCCVTLAAEGKSRRSIRRLKRKNPNSFMVLTGCLASIHKEPMAEMDLLIPQENKNSLVAQVVEKLGSSLATENNLPPDGRIRSFLMIQNGCNRRCSYCIIPSIRGSEVSFPLEKIIVDTKQRVQEGYKELVLSGIVLGAWHYEGLKLNELLQEMLKIPGFRLRISSIDPRDLDQQLIETILHNPQIASHFHIPLQSGSTRILHLMNRLYDANTFTNFVKMIHKIDPTATVTTDVICGFPGETENDFDETFQRINSLPIFDLHVFPFSPRPGTPAFDFTDQVEDSIKKARVERLLKLKPIKRAEHFSRNLGLQKSVLIEKTENGQSFGLTDNYLPVQIAQSHTPGTMLTVTLTAGSAEHLIGIPCEI